MNFWAVFKVAARALARNKMRSALTTLGIIIGTSAVIALVSIGQGAQYMVQGQINSFGSNLLFVMPGNTFQGGVNINSGGGNSLTIEDVLAIEGERDDISGIGQTKAALTLTPNLPDDHKQYLLAKDAGHYGIFNGSKWRNRIAPVLEQWMSRFNAAAAQS